MKKSLSNFAIFLVATALALAICELALRAFHPQTLGVWQKTRDGILTLRPNENGIFHGIETSERYRTNSFGMRDREHRIEKEERAFRILLLGDSQMEGL